MFSLNTHIVLFRLPQGRAHIRHSQVQERQYQFFSGIFPSSLHLLLLCNETQFLHFAAAAIAAAAAPPQHKHLLVWPIELRKSFEIVVPNGHSIPLRIWFLFLSHCICIAKISLLGRALNSTNADTHNAINFFVKLHLFSIITIQRLNGQGRFNDVRTFLLLCNQLPYIDCD